MEWVTEAFDLDPTSDWIIHQPSQSEGWDFQCEIDHRQPDALLAQFRTFFRTRTMVLIAEENLTAIDRLTRIRVSALEQQVTELLHEIIRLRKLLESDIVVSADPALSWISANAAKLSAYVGSYVAFTPARGVVATATTLKALYLSLDGHEHDIHIHYVSEPFVLEDE